MMLNLEVTDCEVSFCLSMLQLASLQLTSLKASLLRVGHAKRSGEYQMQLRHRDHLRLLLLKTPACSSVAEIELYMYAIRE